MKRFRVSEDSMVPTLRPGEEFVATTSLAARTGDIVALEHPGRPGFWLVKRVAAIDGKQATVTSDNPVVSAVDSRSFGPVASTSLMPLVARLDETTFREAIEMLAGEDDALGVLLDRHGMPAFWHRRPGFATLVLLILEQQVSLESGAAVYRRLAEGLRAVTPESVLGSSEPSMREAGVTRQKAGYIVGLAEQVASGRLDLDGLGALGSAVARARLVEIRGIGPWTADAYLLSALLVPDALPSSDRALQVGTAEALGLSDPPDAETMEMLAEPWRPVRAAATRLVWHAYLDSRGRVEPPDPLDGHVPC